MSPLTSRPIDATLSVTKAARLLGVHPNTVRAWSDAGRLRYYRINPRGDRRYRLGDLQRFLAAAAVAGHAEARPSAGLHPAGARRVGPGDPDLAAILRREASGDLGAGGTAMPWVDRGRSPLAPAEREPEPSLVAELTELLRRAGSGAGGVGTLLSDAARQLETRLGASSAVVWQLDGGRLVPRWSSPGAPHHVPYKPSDDVRGRALRAFGRDSLAAAIADEADDGPGRDGATAEVAAAIAVDGQAWGVLAVTLASLTEESADTVAAAAQVLGAVVEVVTGIGRLNGQVHRATAMLRVAGDLGSRLDVDEILRGVVSHAIALFGADRAAVVLRRADGIAAGTASRGLSPGYLATLDGSHERAIGVAATAVGRPVVAVRYAEDPRAADMRATIVQEGYDTICAAPLSVDPEVGGVLTLYHDRPHPWSDEDTEALAAFATQASVAIRTARNFTQMATWTAQLQSIQQLGAQLNRLTSVRDIALAIATELQQLIDYHNVRVYRLYDEMLVPVAMRGQVGEYEDETPEQLRVRVGEGITGWVARHKVPQNLPDAAKDPRGDTIPGTEEDLDESMLLAPMVFEDAVLGVLVLSKLGLHQFSDDDLRLLVIYASFAAQAMANADSTERLRAQSAELERQLRSQRHLLQITESILGTLDAPAVLDQIADRLAELVGYDNISIELYDRAANRLRPLTARGANAEEYLQEWDVGEEGVATWVIEHKEPVLIVDQYDDPRVRHFPSTGPVHGGLIVVPLRGHDGVTGVLTLERIGEGSTFREDEFELVQLFAAQVSVALQNAEAHGAVEVRARTDALTGLLNHGTFREWLDAAVVRGDRFSLVMIDLDRFKAVNDARGHQAGDQLLGQIARAIVGAARESDHVFRYGGDEFVILLPGADGPAATAVSERVRAAVHAVGGTASRWDADGVAVSASFGVATFPVDGPSADLLLLAADRACFVAKRAGPGRIAAAEEGLALAGEFSLQKPTPVDSPTIPLESAAGGADGGDGADGPAHGPVNEGAVIGSASRSDSAA